MPTMQMPSIPTIPGLKKNSAAEAEGGVEASATANPESGAVGGEDEEDRSRYIRYGPCKMKAIVFVLL